MTSLRSSSIRSHHSLLQIARAPLCLALIVGCSAGEDGADGPPEYVGGLPPPGSVMSGGPATPAPGSAGASSSPGQANNGAGGASSTSIDEPVGTDGIGLDPAAPDPAGEQSGGIGGAGQQPAGGAAGSMATPPVGGAGSSSLPPSTEPPPNTAPPANAGCEGLFFCDDFEAAAVGASPDPALWQVIDGYAPRDSSANVQVSSTVAHGGSQSVRVLASGSRNGIVASLPQQSYFVRAWLQLDSVPQGPVLIGVGADQNSEVRLRLWSPGWATVNVSQGDAVRPNGATSGNCPTCVTLTPNQWFCAEMQIDNATRSARLWIDGVEAANLPNGDGGVPAQPDSPVVFLGSMGLQGGQTGVWIDDVAAGPERIGCD